MEYDIANTNLDLPLLLERSSTILAKSDVTLPNPVSVTGRIYNIVYYSGIVTITNPVVDAGVTKINYQLNSTSGSKRITVQANGTEWIIIASS